MTCAHYEAGEHWDRVAVNRVEALQQAVMGAGLDAVQLSCGAMGGSLAFSTHDDIVYSSGYVEGCVALTGALSDSMISLGVGIQMAPGSCQWLGEVDTGAIGVFQPGDLHEGIYAPGSVYLCASLSGDRLEQLAADMDLVLDHRQLGGTGVSPRSFSAKAIAPVRHAFGRLHAGHGPAAMSGSRLGRGTLERAIAILARSPQPVLGRRDLSRYSLIVRRAQDFIAANLEQPLSIGMIARAAVTSQSTLYRAFHHVFGEAPQSFVRKLRLNRIRHDLATDQERLCTVTIVANRWGISELGRLAGWYRDLFGELPSATRARRIEALHEMSRMNELRRSA
ncbi:AraC family transcriptional regulator [Sphingobium sp. AP49]|uniref:AraC family transcriptional regulator n=1 Tax=Sphingobium sp. AP49 TaxID=1144307 RepID=UPI00026ECACB|nr:AraC family transcriptional regulator [Sphingobium sp. AP49]WHO37965.1 AraC family transcriptional regulator [Sphingobium sp. AP49]